MPTLDIEKFNPTRAEITKMVDQFKNLEIKGINDLAGYQLVDEARKKLKRSRVQIEKDGKLLRSEALAFQKAVIEKEKELVMMIKPCEDELASKQEAIDTKKEQLMRMELLPERHGRLLQVGIEISDEEILWMDNNQFDEFFNQKNSEYIAEKERIAAEARAEEDRQLALERQKLEDEKKKLAQDKLDLEREKQKVIDIQKARDEEAIRVKKEMEDKIQRDKELADIAEKQAVIDKANAEKARLEAEEEERQKLEKRKAYQAFLAKHEYQEEGFYIMKKEDRIILYKELGQFKI